MTKIPPTRLHLIRMSRGISQLDLSLVTGLYQSEISRIERGLVSLNARLTKERLTKLADALGVSPPERLLERTWDLAEVHASASREAPHEP